jgi:hypothetical protein
MRCLPAVGLDTNVPLWISKSSFFRHFDQQDFMCRDVQQVVDASWTSGFHSDGSGNRFFHIPPVAVRHKATQFISGQHRTAVLLRHLEIVPLAFDSRFTTSDEEEWVWSIASGPIEQGVHMELPDLPIGAVLP